MISATEAVVIHPIENRFIRSRYSPTKEGDWGWCLQTDEGRILLIQPVKKGLSWSIETITPQNKAAADKVLADVTIKDVSITDVDGIPRYIDMRISGPEIKEASYRVRPKDRFSKKILDETGKMPHLYGGFYRTIVLVTLGRTASGKTSLALAARHYRVRDDASCFFTDIEFCDEDRKASEEIEVCTTDPNNALRGAQFTITLRNERDERHPKAKLGLILVDNPGELMNEQERPGAGIIGGGTDDGGRTEASYTNKLNRMRINLEDPVVDLILAVYKGRTLLGGAEDAYTNIKKILEDSIDKVINVITEGDLLLDKAETVSAPFMKKDSPLFRKCSNIEEIEEHVAAACALFARMTHPHCVLPTFLVTTGTFKKEKTAEAGRKAKVWIRPGNSINVDALFAYIINRFIKATPRRKDF